MVEERDMSFRLVRIIVNLANNFVLYKTDNCTLSVK